MVEAARRKPLPKAVPPGSVPCMAHDPNEPEEGGGRRAALIGLVICAVLVVVAYYLVNSLRDEGKLEDCLASGRSNCAPLDLPTHK